MKRTGAGVAIDVEALYTRYGGMVFRRCRALLKDDEKASDAMHDVFVQVLRYRARLEEEAPSSLLYRIATNVSLNRIRSETRHPEDPDEALLGRIASLDSGDERPLARVMLERIFGREPESTRYIAVMHLVDGLTYEEVATEVGLSVSGVRKRLRSLRSRLELEEDMGS